MDRPTALRTLAVPVLVVGAAIFVTFLVWPVPLTPAGLLLAALFAVLTAVLGSMEFSFQGKVSLSPDSAAVVLALLLGGPAVAAIAVATATVYHQIRRRRAPLRIAYTPAQFMVALAAFVALYGLLVGLEFGAHLAERIVAGEYALGVRYVLAVVLGTALYVTVNDALVLSYVRLESEDSGIKVGTILLSDVAGSVALLALVLPTVFFVGAFGGAALLLTIPLAGVVWGIWILLRARLAGTSLDLATRLSAIFTVAVGTVFLVLSLVIVQSFTARYTDAVVQGQEAFGRGVVMGLEDVVRRGESLRFSPATPASLQRLVDESPDLGYAILFEQRPEGPRQLASRYRADVAPLGDRISADLTVPSPRQLYRWTDGQRTLRAHSIRLPVRGPTGAEVAHLHLGLDLGAVDRAVNALLLRTGGATLILFLLLLGVLRSYIRRGLVSPLERVGSAIERIAQGDADLSERLPVTGDHEIAELGRHFNHFADNLVELISTTAHATHAVASGAEQVAASGEELAASSASVAETMGQAVERLERERAEAQTLHQLTSELAAVSALVTERALAARQDAEEVVGVAETNRQEIGRAGDALLEVREVVRESGEATGELIQAAEQVGEFVHSIREIAEQTNLLALNAAIEAARAGEHGRGFAVVAEEIRKLADASASSATRASQLIRLVSDRSDRVAAAMRRGGEKVEGVERISSASREALRTILESIRRIQGSIGEISDRIVEEREIVGRVDQQVSSIEALVGENAAMAAEVGAATEEQTASTEQMSQLSQRMVEEVERLEAQIARFRLPESGETVAPPRVKVPAGV
jgi:methyl-accepting chemotaxis protein